MTQAFDFFFNYTAHIDVIRKNKLELVYFILLPYSKALPKDKKYAFHENVDRTNVKSKVAVFYIIFIIKGLVGISD